MDTDTYAALVRVLAYALPDEEKNYNECGRPSSHVYHDFLRLQEWADMHQPDTPTAVTTTKHVCECGNEHETEDSD